jgi:hypothetical protein
MKYFLVAAALAGSAWGQSQPEVQSKPHRGTGKEIGFGAV